MRYLPLSVLVAGATVMAGCKAGVDVTDMGLVGKTTPYKPEFKINAGSAGVQIPGPGQDQARLKAVVNNVSRRLGGARANPFALTVNEYSFEQQQDMERLFARVGGFSMEYEPPIEVGPQSAQLVEEAQPYRRLSGIIVGDSVTAIIELGGGQTEIIRPGMRIPNTPWRVKSIDMNKATLIRDGNVLPKQITVRLESPPAGMMPPTGGGPGGFPGGPPGGFPGGPPGGFPGGPPGGPGMGGPGGMGMPGGVGGPDF